MKLSIVMPVYNEINNIENILKRVSDVTYDKEIIVVDDGSNDGTREFLMNNFKNGKNIKVIFHKINTGKTAAIRTALKHVTGNIVIIQDGDLEYNPHDYGKLIEPILSGDSSVVYGSRFLSMNQHRFVWDWFLSKLCGNHYEIRYLSHFLGVKFLNILASVLYGIRITDIATGYKVFKAETIKDMVLYTNRFEFCYEITAKIAKRNIKIKEVPISYHPRLNSEGKKITWKDGVSAIWVLMKCRFIN